MGKNAEQFLDSFVAIERELRKSTKAGPQDSFYHLVEVASHLSAVVRRFAHDLRQFCDLRNAIVHTRSVDKRFLAEPLDSTVTAIRRLEGQILQPPKVESVFLREVLVVSPRDSVARAVSLMSQNWVSQLPVVDNGSVADVVSSQTITRWLGAKVTEDVLSLSENTVKETLPFKEPGELFKFVSRTAPLVECLDMFAKYEDEGQELAAILVTQSGKVREQLLGIMTVSDMPIILKALRG